MNETNEIREAQVIRIRFIYIFLLQLQLFDTLIIYIIHSDLANKGKALVHHKVKLIVGERFLVAGRSRRETESNVSKQTIKQPNSIVLSKYDILEQKISLALQRNQLLQNASTCKASQPCSGQSENVKLR